MGGRNLESIYNYFWTSSLLLKFQERWFSVLIKHRTVYIYGLERARGKKMPFQKMHLLPQIGKLRLGKESGIFKALRYIRGKAESWSLRSPVVFLLKALHYSGLCREHPSHWLMLFEGWYLRWESHLFSSHWLVLVIFIRNDTLTRKKRWTGHRLCPGGLK